MTRNLIRSLATVAGLSVALAACDGTGPDRPAGVTLLLTDAPGNVDEAWVKIDRVYMQGTGGQSDLLTDQSEWIELTELAGETTATLVEGVIVPPGTYGQMRFIITEAYLVAEDGRVYAMPGSDLPDDVTADGVLHGPSFAQTGIKVNMPDGGITVDEGSTVLVVDFDVAESFGQQAGASGKWVMHPALRATEFTLSGNIQGVVSLGEDDEGNPLEFPAADACGGWELGLTDFIPQAVRGETVASGAVDEDGAYLIAYVHPDVYGMTFKENLIRADDETGEEWTFTFEATVDPVEVTVPQSGSVTADYTITAISCADTTSEE